MRLLPLNPERLDPLHSPCLGMSVKQCDKSVPVLSAFYSSVHKFTYSLNSDG